MQLQEDFEKEEENIKENLFTEELLVQYERIQVLLNQSPAKSSFTQEEESHNLQL